MKTCRPWPTRPCATASSSTSTASPKASRPKTWLGQLSRRQIKMRRRQFSETNAVIMSIGTLASQSSSSCRDKGWGGVDEGALCLSSSGYDPFALRNPDESRSHKDKHKAPTHPHVHPLSLQNFPTPHRSSIVTL